MISGWGRAVPSRARLLGVTREDELGELIRTASGRGLIARGLGRSYGDAAQNGGGAVLRPFELAAADFDVAAGRVTAPAGMSVDRLLRTTVPAGWVLPALPGTRQVTLGGAVAADVHGKNQQRDGALGCWLEQVTLLDGLGHRRVLAPDREPDAFWATVAGMGLTGALLDVTMRLLPVSTSWLRVRRTRFPDLSGLLAAMDDPARRARYSVAWLDALAPGSSCGRGVLEEAEHAEPYELPAAAAREPLAFGPRPGLTVPPLPVNVVTPLAMRAYNEVRWRRSQGVQEQVVPMSSFFHQLDALRSWTRLYGPRGFVQYHFLVPPDRSDVVGRALALLARRRVPPMLAVLKRHGPGDPAHLSFPAPGWSLALDIPAGVAGLRQAAAELDEMVAAAGGRVYLAKDSLLGADCMRVMYPRLDEWRAVRDGLDPHRRFQSDLGRRLALC